MISPDELAAVVAAMQAVMAQAHEAPAPEVSAWKRAARLEAIGVQ